MNFRFLSVAKDEADNAADFYEQRESGLGLEFILQVEQAIQQIQRDPESWPRLSSSFRRARVARFPYDVIFRVMPDEFVVYAIAHHHRRADFWTRRRDE